MNVRRATPHDAAAIRALIDCYTADGTLLPRTVEFISAQSDHCLVAEENDEVVGCVHLDEYAPSLSEVRSMSLHHQRGSGAMSERHKPHNGRDVDGSHRVRAADVDDVMSDPEGANFIRDDVRHGGAVADTGPDAGRLGERIEELVHENKED